MTTFRVGDRVIANTGQPRFDGPGVVKKINPKTIAVLLDGQVRGVRMPPYYLRAETPDDVAGRTTLPSGAVVSAVPVPVPAARFVTGQAVRVTGGPVDKYPGLYVVIGFSGADAYKLARLGGDGDRYLRNMQAVWLTDANREVGRRPAHAQ